MEISFDLFFPGEQNQRKINLTRLRRSHSNPLELPNERFIGYFRLNKAAFLHILEQTGDNLRTAYRTSSVPIILKLSAVLRFLAEGSYQKCSGNDFNVGLAQPTFSRIFAEVLNVLKRHICPIWIKGQLTHEEQSASKVSFYRKTGFPGVIGCVDGTHISIIAPRREEQHLYRNRKGYYSLNVMIVCDYNMNISCVDARYPGSNHDSFIWNASSYKANLHRNIPEGSWILGDAGYPLAPYIMTPFRSTEEGIPEARYNYIHSRTRNIVERTIGVLKNKFRCLPFMRGLHYRPCKATQIVNVYCALHNVSQHFKVVFPAEIYEVIGSRDGMEQVETTDNTEHADSVTARNIRNQIMISL